VEGVGLDIESGGGGGGGCLIFAWVCECDEYEREQCFLRRVGRKEEERDVRRGRTRGAFFYFLFCFWVSFPH
jgi:hypothetical protein